MLAAGKKQSFWNNLRQTSGRVYAPELADAPVVYAGYCVAARLEGALTVQGSFVSTLSLTDALLVAALLRPFRIWWIVLAGALPAHLFHELAMANHGSALAALAVFACKFSAALGAVALMRQLSVWPPRLQTPKDVFVFIVLGCALPSLIGTSLQRFVHPGQVPGELPGLWPRLFFSKMAALAIAVPAAVSTVQWVKGGHSISARRFAEATALVAGILLSSFATFGLSAATGGTGWALSGLVLACLLWAAVRFGVGGTSACLLLMALCVSASASHRRGVFREVDPGVVAMDVSFVGLSVTLLLLAARLQPREAATSRDAGPDQPRFGTADWLPAERELSGKEFARVLTAFCRKFSASSNLPVNVSVETAAQRISADVARCSFRLVRAGLCYAASETGATEARVRIAGAGDRVFLALAENGTGPLPATPVENWAAGNRMKAYVESLSGEFRIAKRETRGTLVMVVLPL